VDSIEQITTLRWMRAIGDTIFAAGTVALVLFIAGLSKGYSYEQAPAPVVKKRPAPHTA
jgi:nitric oxide reductase subunit B